MYLDSKYIVPVEGTEGEKSFDQEEKITFSFKNILNKFTKDSKSYNTQNLYKSFPFEKPPTNWDPYSKVRKFLEKQEESQNYDNTRESKKLSLNDRAKLLGEKRRVGPKKSELLRARTEEFQSKLTNKTRELLKIENKFRQGNSAFITRQTMADNVYYDDNEKNERFRMFKYNKENNFIVSLPFPSHYSSGQRKKEIEEFERKFYRIQAEEHLEPKKDVNEKEQDKKEEVDKGLLMKIEDLKAKIENSKKQRIVEDWVPDRLVCIRFGVKQPKKHLINKKEEKKGFDEIVIKAVENDLKNSDLRTPKLQENKLDDRIIEGEELIMPDENKFGARNEDKDLFDSIFNSSDED